MDAAAKAKFQRISNTKVSQLLNEIRGKNVTVAEHIVGSASKGASTLIAKTMNSAAANLSVKLGKKLDPEQVWVKTAFADKGPVKNLRRMRPGPMGRSMPFRRSMCHLTIIVSDSK